MLSVNLLVAPRCNCDKNKDSEDVDEIKFVFVLAYRSCEFVLVARFYVRGSIEPNS